MKNLQTLPKVRDSWSYLYVEHCRIEQEAYAIAIHDQRGKVSVPCAMLAVLMAGPGTRITHAAIRALADNGCTLLWVGEEAVRFYSQGLGETRSAAHLMHQARLWSNPASRLEVVRRMYEMRFDTKLEPDLTLQQIRGLEGVRVREAYASASRESGVAWTGRDYKREAWGRADPVNRALSAANSCLYGVCHAAIVSAGYSPGLGFIHTGKMLSFVYDVADLYKTQTTIPAAFEAASEGSGELEGRVRRHLRDVFREGRLLGRIVQDIDRMLGLTAGEEGSRFDLDEAEPGGLWDPDEGEVPGGTDWSGHDKEVSCD